MYVLIFSLRSPLLTWLGKLQTDALVKVNKLNRRLAVGSDIRGWGLLLSKVAGRLVDKVRSSYQMIDHATLFGTQCMLEVSL